MNIKIFVLIIIVLNSLLVGQEYLDGPQRELYLYRSGFPSYPPLVSAVNTISAIWTKYCRDPQSNAIVYLCSECSTSSSVTIDNYLLASSGWNICNDDSGLSYPYFGYTVYKMSNNITEDYFYIDYRDCNYKPTGTFGYLSTDITITLNLNFDGLGGTRYEYNVSAYPKVPIPNGSILKIWDIEYLSPPQPYLPNTSCFPNFLGNCLILIPSQTGNHPRLVWGPNPNFNAASYRIYRAISNTPVAKPITLTYSLIQQNIPNNVFEFTDYAVDIVSGYQYAYYYVVGYNGSTESSETNYVGTAAQFNKQLPDVAIIPKEDILFQNYPNPFNPSTKISYSIKEEELVTLKVYCIGSAENGIWC